MTIYMNIFIINTEQLFCNNNKKKHRIICNWPIKDEDSASDSFSSSEDASHPLSDIEEEEASDSSSSSEDSSYPSSEIEEEETSDSSSTSSDSSHQSSDNEEEEASYSSSPSSDSSLPSSYIEEEEASNSSRRIKVLKAYLIKRMNFDFIKYFCFVF